MRSVSLLLLLNLLDHAGAGWMSGSPGRKSRPRVSLLSVSRRESPQKQNMEKVVETLMELAQGVEDERDRARALGQERDTKCAKALDELKISIRDANRTVRTADEDLRAAAAGVQGVQATIKDLKAKIQAGAEEITKLTKKLKDLRRSKVVSLQQSYTSLQQVEAVLAKANLREQQEMHKRHRPSSISQQVSYLHQLSSRLSSSTGEESASMTSLLQTDSVGSVLHSSDSSASGLLKADKQELMTARNEAMKGYEEDEAKLVDLLKIAQEEVKKLEDSLNEQQPILADKLRQSSESNMTVMTAKSSLARDGEIMAGVQAKCNFMAASVEKLNKLRLKLSDGFRMPAKLLKKMDTMVFLAQDLQNLKEGPLSLVQVSSHSSQAGRYREAMRARLWDTTETEESSRPVSAEKHPHITPEASDKNGVPDKAAGMIQEDSGNTGPFDEVTGMIKALIASLRDEANQEVTRHQWCADSQSQNLNERVMAQEKLDKLTAENRWTKTAIARLAAEIAFLKTEIPRLQQAATKAGKEIEEERALVKVMDADQKEGNEILMKVEIVVRDLCQLDEKTVLLQRSNTTRKSSDSTTGSGSGGVLLLQRKRLASTSNKFNNCEEAVRLIGEALVTSQELNEATLAYLKQFEDMTLAFKKKVEAAKKQQEGNLLAAESASAKRANELAGAEEDERKQQEDLRLLLESKRQLEESCGPKVESAEERLQRRAEEIEALKNAINVLEGQAIPV